MLSFDEYVDQIIKSDEESDDKAPVCIFPTNNGECYVNKRDPEGGCANCEWAELAYMFANGIGFSRVVQYMHNLQELIEYWIYKSREARTFAYEYNTIRSNAGLKRKELFDNYQMPHLCPTCKNKDSCAQISPEYPRTVCCSYYVKEET